MAFFIYAGVSATWSPRDQVLVNFDFEHMQFSFRSEMLRVGLQILALGGLIGAAMRLDDGAKARLQRIAHVALFLQLGILVVLTVFEQQILQMLTAYRAGHRRGRSEHFAQLPDHGGGDAGSGRWCGARPLTGRWSALRCRAGRCRRGDHDGARRAGRHALDAVRGGLHGGRSFSSENGFQASVSSEWRARSCRRPGCSAWSRRAPISRRRIPHRPIGRRSGNRVISIINEHPITGGGLGVLRTVRETIETGMFAGQLTVPNHPHSMMLQLWAETGAIGAALLSLAIVFAGWRMPDQRTLGASGLRAAAVVGAMVAIGTVSFELWNEWWWAVGGLLATLAVSTPATLVARA